MPTQSNKFVAGRLAAWNYYGDNENIAAKGKFTMTVTQLDELIAYFEANAQPNRDNEQVLTLDFALFYNESDNENAPSMTGTITEPYKKQETQQASTTKRRRSL